MKNQSKFQSEMRLTVDEYHAAIASKIVSLIRELESSLGKEKAHKIVSEWAQRNAENEVKDEIEKLGKPVENFEEIKRLL